MGLSSVFSNETAIQTDGNQGPKSMSALPFDPKLLGQLKHLLPGAKFVILLRFVNFLTSVHMTNFLEDLIKA